MNNKINTQELSSPESIEINTVFGKLTAAISGDPTYPGVHICIEQQDDDGKYEKQLALVECTPDIPKEGGHTLRLLVWNNDTIDDYTDEFTFFEETPVEENKSVIWEKYLQYLSDWSHSHSSSGFYGITPACFNEWLGCEYSRGNR